MAAIAERFSGLDVLVNNSGIIRDRTIKKLTLEEFESVVRVNLAGTFNVTQKAAAILRQGGRIINLSSVSGQMGLFGQANYSSSKAAIIALTKVSAREFARQQITVNAIAPGFIDVGMSKGMPDEVTENFKKQIPLGRLGAAHEIVDAALFLASPMASYITGHVLECERRLLHGLEGRKSDAPWALCYPEPPWRALLLPSIPDSSDQNPVFGNSNSLGDLADRLQLPLSQCIPTDCLRWHALCIRLRRRSVRTAELHYALTPFSLSSHRLARFAARRCANSGANSNG